MSVDSWTPGPKPLCHRHPTGPHPSGLLWTPWTPGEGNSTNSNFALALHPFLDTAVDRGVEHAGALVDQAGLAHHVLRRRHGADAGEHGPAARHAGLGLGE